MNLMFILQAPLGSRTPGKCRQVSIVERITGESNTHGNNPGMHSAPTQKCRVRLPRRPDVQPVAALVFFLTAILFGVQPVLANPTNGGLIGEVQTMKGFLVPTGTVVAFAGETAPPGWMLCHGQPLNREKYKPLFDVVGTLHGAPDDQHFNLPDYRGRFLRGVAEKSELDPDKDGRTEMAKSGAVGNRVGSVQPHELFEHNHAEKTGPAGRHSHPIPVNKNSEIAAGKNLGLGNSAGFRGDVIVAHHGLSTTEKEDHDHPIPPSGGKETRPVNAYVNWIIKL